MKDYVTGDASTDDKVLNVMMMLTEDDPLTFEEAVKKRQWRDAMKAAYTPQQNGVAERKNRTIMNMVRSMLTEKQVPKMFWPEAVRWSVHILNRCPTVAVQNQTPEEAWSGVKPVIDYFRVFGCVAHAHVPDQKRSKLDDKSRKCVLLGVSDESKAYRLYDPVSKKIIVSRDVIFEEDESWNWGNDKEENMSSDLEWGDDHNNNEDERYNDAPANSNEPGSSSNASPTPNQESSEIGSPFNDGSDGTNSPSPNVGRARKTPVWMKDYVTGDVSTDDEGLNVMMMLTEDDPLTFEEAVKNRKWRDAMKAEIDSIEKNKTWELTILPAGTKPIGVKWVFKTKLNEKGEVEKHKARLVAKGYAQQYGVDYTEVFAPVARLDTIRLILALAAHHGWDVFQLDVKSAFLQGELKEEVFVQQPPGYEKKGEEDKVYKLTKALYGLKQAPRAWYSKIEAYFVREGFARCSSEHTLFTKSKEGGIEVIQSPNGIFVCQRKYAWEVLARFDMGNSNPVLNPIVPVDMWAVQHWRAGKRLLRYLKGTTELGIFYKRKSKASLEVYTDSLLITSLGIPWFTTWKIPQSLLAFDIKSALSVWLRSITGTSNFTPWRVVVAGCSFSTLMNSLGIVPFRFESVAIS
ncbi:retrovirus-related pol polyprotein from transposon TNT 1-94 [Tanacetum coccineum]|uniref:Retrovirus-related pol polyprotein from transposon TNT 1-94 n=1 Tax=Tanacetum coccineum TaxID=301880 RepID=A0ABQ5IXI9_9ASTR